ncbi:MAG: phenylalanine--tRNA ligase subunit alpha [Candidatus Magasanikbacteria bacterium]|nr:phenylalanine--tRNA ligase subunit alpha [Candidatus Magasanikbacteria bacterium]
MDKDLENLKKQALSAVQAARSVAQLDELENKWFGRAHGELTQLMKGLKDLSPEERKTAGEELNHLKVALSEAVAEKRGVLEGSAWAVAAETERVDITQPALPKKSVGHLHPNTLVQRDLEDLFTSMGFMVLDGPELESDYYNFTALNIPENHPARDMQDTFYVKGHKNWVMRTHTSPMQVRAMQKFGAPLRLVVPGKCFRNEATDVRHEHTFYQLEGLVVDTHITLSHLKGVLEAVARHLYGPATKVRVRPKFYPFVEPGINGEVTCFLCSGKGCRVCKCSGWLEIFGAGLVHPHVLKEGGIDPAQYQGFAFGLGVTRLVMLKYGIDDIRLLESGDMSFLEQF